MPDVKHDGCFDCESKEDPILKSATCYRKDKKGALKITNAALCGACFKREMETQKGEGRFS